MFISKNSPFLVLHNTSIGEHGEHLAQTLHAATWLLRSVLFGWNPLPLFGHCMWHTSQEFRLLLRTLKGLHAFSFMQFVELKHQPSTFRRVWYCWFSSLHLVSLLAALRRLLRMGRKPSTCGLPIFTHEPACTLHCDRKQIKASQGTAVGHTVSFWQKPKQIPSIQFVAEALCHVGFPHSWALVGLLSCHPCSSWVSTHLEPLDLALRFWYHLRVSSSLTVYLGHSSCFTEERTEMLSVYSTHPGDALRAWENWLWSPHLPPPNPML